MPAIRFFSPWAAIKPVSAGRLVIYAVSFRGDNKLDLYSLAVSDAYQDFFGAGIFVGKGIYDVNAFEQSLLIVYHQTPCLAMICLKASTVAPGWSH